MQMKLCEFHRDESFLERKNWTKKDGMNSDSCVFVSGILRQDRLCLKNKNSAEKFGNIIFILPSGETKHINHCMIPSGSVLAQGLE